MRAQVSPHKRDRVFPASHFKPVPKTLHLPRHPASPIEKLGLISQQGSGLPQQRDRVFSPPASLESPVPKSPCPQLYPDALPAQRKNSVSSQQGSGLPTAETEFFPASHSEAGPQKPIHLPRHPAVQRKNSVSSQQGLRSPTAERPSFSRRQRSRRSPKALQLPSLSCRPKKKLGLFPPSPSRCQIIRVDPSYSWFLNSGCPYQDNPDHPYQNSHFAFV